MARTNRVDPARDLLTLIGRHAQDTSKQVLPQLDTGEVIQVGDPVDGTVVQLDNMQVAASDCLLLGTHAPHVGDRVMVLVHMEEFWILGGIQGDSTGASTGPPSGPAGGDLTGTYPNPQVVSAPPDGAAGGDLTGTYPNPTIEPNVALTGAPTAPTATPGTSTTQIASTAFVGASVATQAATSPHPFLLMGA